VFFSEPSVAVAVDGVADLEIVLFAGDAPAGAISVQITFDPGDLAIDAISPGGSEELSNVFGEVRSAGRAAFVTANDESLDRPIGTVSLAHLQVRPLASVGSIVPLQLEVRSLLSQDGTVIQGMGFSGEIVVTSTAGFSDLSLSKRMTEDRGLISRARSFRRPGEPVKIFQVERDGTHYRVAPVSVTVTEPSSEAHQR